MLTINKKFQNNVIIITGFIILLVLLAVVMALAISRIYDNEQQVHEVSKQLSDVGHAFIMRDADSNRALIIYRMAQTNDAMLQDKLYQGFSLQSSSVTNSLKKLQQRVTFKKDVKLFNQTKSAVQIGAAIQEETVEDILNNRLNRAHRVLATEIIPIQLNVSRQLAELSTAFQDNADNELNAMSKQNEVSINLISIFGSLAMLLGLIITYFVSNRVIQSEKAFVEQRILAENASNAKSMFLATMSHEIRSPLTAISGFSNLMRKTKLTDEKLDSCLESIQRNSTHLLYLINDILDITKIESGDFTIEETQVSPFVLLDEFYSSISSIVRAKNLRMKINYVFPLPPNIITDSIRLKQILINLTSNAIKFTDKGSVNITVSCDKKNDTMLFEVVDTGIGLTKDQQQKIFGSFTQADSSTTRKYGGSGLGLNICKQIVSKMGGEISVASTVGRGSKFSFYINVGKIVEKDLVYSTDHKYNSEDDSNFEKSLHDTESAQYLTGRILLVEDIIDNQNLIEMYVTDVGADITIVNNGAEAVEICSENEFDLILMDIQMPVMNGIEATRIIRKTNSKTPIIYLTANAMKSDFEESMNAGANDFLTKPIDTVRFNQMLFHYLDFNVKSDSDNNKFYWLKELTEKFIQGLPNRVATIRDLNKRQLWQQLEDESHNLKGLGGTFGFQGISTISNDINFHCQQKEYDKISNLVEKLKVVSLQISNSDLELKKQS